MADLDMEELILISLFWGTSAQDETQWERAKLAGDNCNILSSWWLGSWPLQSSFLLKPLVEASKVNIKTVHTVVSLWTKHHIFDIKKPNDFNVIQLLWNGFISLTRPLDVAYLEGVESNKDIGNYYRQMDQHSTQPCQTQNWQQNENWTGHSPAKNTESLYHEYTQSVHDIYSL